MTRRRIGLLVTLALALLVAPLAADAQTPAKVPRIDVLGTGSPAATSFFEPFLQALQDLGYVEGQTIAFEYRSDGNLDRLPVLAAELVRLPVNLILVGASASALVAQQATTTIPIVFFSASDPVGRGLVASLARPGGNITGGSFDVSPEVEGKRLQLLTEAVPTVSRWRSWWGYRARQPMTGMSRHGRVRHGGWVSHSDTSM
jgi:putative ABC transport system substrate-binding protein